MLKVSQEVRCKETGDWLTIDETDNTGIYMTFHSTGNMAYVSFDEFANYYEHVDSTELNRLYESMTIEELDSIDPNTDNVLLKWIYRDRKEGYIA